MAGWQKRTGTFLRSLLLEYRSPRQLAFAVALGVFVGVSPLWGLHTVLALGLAFLLRLNKSAVFLGTLISNPWVAPLLIFASLETGSLIFYGTPTPLAFQEIRETFQDPNWNTILEEYVKPYFFGAFVVASLLAFLSYWITFLVSRSAQRERPDKGP